MPINRTTANVTQRGTACTVTITTHHDTEALENFRKLLAAIAGANSNPEAVAEAASTCEDAGAVTTSKRY